MTSGQSGRSETALPKASTAPSTSPKAHSAHAEAVEGFGKIGTQRDGAARMLERLLHVALLEQDRRQVVVGLGIVGRQRKRVAVRRGGFGGPTQLLEGAADVVERLRKPRSQHHGPLEGGQRFVPPLLRGQKRPQIILAIRGAGIDPRRVAQKRNRFGTSARPGNSGSPAPATRRNVRLQRQNLPVYRLRLAGAACLMVSEARVE